MNRYTGFFAAYGASRKRGNPVSKEDVVLDFTNGKTSSLKALSVAELNQLTLQLNNISGKPLPPKGGDRADKMRKSIIAIFHGMNRPVAEAIAWAEKQGVRGEKKKFNDYTPGELYVLIGIAEKIAADWRKAIRKRVAEEL